MNCIYCGVLVDPSKGEGDHVLPDALGAFPGTRRFRRICIRCNSKIGVSEKHLLNCTVEGLFLTTVLSGRRKRRRLKLQGAKGAPAPTFTINSGDHCEIVDPSVKDPFTVNSRDQIVLCDGSGKATNISLNPAMTEHSLRKKLSKSKMQDIQKVWLHANESTWNHYLGLLRLLYPDYKLTLFPSTDAGTHKMQVQAHFRMNDHPFRALAKMVFHYYLLHSVRDVRGDEPEFLPIRRFIMEGGKIGEFFHPEITRFVTSFRVQFEGEIMVPAHFCHVLAMDESERTVWGYINLSMGPRRIGSGYHVKISERQNRLVLPDCVCGHVYVYSSTADRGEVRRASISRIA